MMAFSGCAAAATEIPITLTDFAFDPKPVAVPAGQKLAIVLQNKGSVEHTFTIAQLRVASEAIAPGKSARLEFSVPNGVYKVICTIAGHEDQGMVGEVRATRSR